MMGFKSFWPAAATLTDIELMHMIRKGQMNATGRLRPAQQFYALANGLSLRAHGCPVVAQDCRQNQLMSFSRAAAASEYCSYVGDQIVGPGINFANEERIIRGRKA